MTNGKPRLTQLSSCGWMRRAVGKTKWRRQRGGAASEWEAWIALVGAVSQRVARARARCAQPVLPLLRLVDVPEDRGRGTIEYAGQRLAPGARYQKLAERDVDHLVVVFLLDFGGDLLLLLRRGGPHERVAQLLDLRIIRPAEPAAVLATPAHRDVDDRVHHVGGGPVGE